VEEELQKIFEDDGYRRTSEEGLKVGDLVTYWLPEQPRLKFLHVGMIFELKEMALGMTGHSVRIPWVLSKMDSTSGEVLHHYRDVTFIEGVEPEVVFLTDRPASAGGSR
jgi:hypothetical protein